MRPHHTRSAGGPTYIWHPSYSNPTTITEGTTYSYYIQTTNVPNGTTLYWSITHGTTSSADFSSNSGSFTVNNNIGVFSISPTDDGINDAGETFTLNVRTESTSGPIVLTRSITLNNAILSAIITGPDNLTEGTYYTYTVTTTGVPNGSYVYVYVGSGGQADVEINGWNGIYISGGTGQFEIYVIKNDGFDTPEDFYMYINYNNNLISNYEYRTISFDVEDPLWTPTGVYAFNSATCYNYSVYTFCEIGTSDTTRFNCHYQEIEQNRDNPEIIRGVGPNAHLVSGQAIILGWFNGSNWIPSVGRDGGYLGCENRFMTYYWASAEYTTYTCCDCYNWYDCWYTCDDC
jgi:hypothetical protein